MRNRQDSALHFKLLYDSTGKFKGYEHFNVHPRSWSPNSRFVLSEMEAGRGASRRLTNPVHLGGVVGVLSAKNRYTKKIVVLINELDFSAVEFLAVILQDNKRAALFGERTGGGLAVVSGESQSRDISV